MTGRAVTCRRESGFTLVEVLVAVLMLSVGIIVVFTAMISSKHLTSAAQVHEAATNFAEQQLDALRQKAAEGYSDFGMTYPAPVADPSDPNDPDYYVTTVNGTPCLEIQDNFQAGGSQRSCEPFVQCSSLCVPGTTQTISGYQGLNGSTYDVYVTEHQDSASSTTGNGCVTSPPVCLTGASDEERITVAVRPLHTAGPSGSRKPVWLSTIITSPTPAPAQ